ncbi:tetratricopeptide repeat protein [Citromicrobium bathyomarinum]|uniref:tetratricopeptide repeat protein n=1 Tax=Sphingomonadales TaxID=204457 RepID=UPI000C678427|nr:hypothetical protein [Citromicrobium sp.]|tara:strand:+ start:1150 stop:1866 length:717 start_codon:yes stop_codon:yes gene_type:complete
MHKILLAIAALACLANTGDQIEALTDSGEYAAAFSIAREAAEAGDPEALDWLGWFYEFGNGVERDPAMAARYYRAAAAQGENHARWRLGVMIDQGETPGEPEEAVALFRQAAGENYLHAVVSLAVMQATGRGTPQDYAAALQNYMAAAALGSDHAARGVGVMIWNGEGVEADREEAAAWFLLSAAMGNEEGGDALDAALGALGDAADERAIARRASEIADTLGLDILVEFEEAPDAGV